MEIKNAQKAPAVRSGRGEHIGISIPPLSVSVKGRGRWSQKSGRSSHLLPEGGAEWYDRTGNERDSEVIACHSLR